MAKMQTILFYGDSNTYGYDPRNVFSGRYPEEIRWTDRLKKESLHWKILVNAMNGREIPAGEAAISRVVEIIRRQRAQGGLDWFAVMLGTNDLFGAPAPAAADYAAAKMNAFLQRIRGEFPDLSVLVIGPAMVGSQESPDLDMRYLFSQNRRMNLLFHVLATQMGLEYINAAEWDPPMSFDEVHLAEEGHRVFAAHIKQWLEEQSADC